MRTVLMLVAAMALVSCDDNTTNARRVTQFSHRVCVGGEEYAISGQLTSYTQSRPDRARYSPYVGDVHAVQLGKCPTHVA